MNINKMTVIPAPENFITINDEGYYVDKFTIEGSPQYGAVQAIQWFGPHGGQIEYEKGPAGGIKQDVLQPYVKMWQRARAQSLRKAHTNNVNNLIETTSLIAAHLIMIQQTEDQLAKLDKQISGLDELIFESGDEQLATASASARSGVEATRTRLNNMLTRIKNEHAVMMKSEAVLAAAQGAIDEVAKKAEAEIA